MALSENSKDEGENLDLNTTVEPLYCGHLGDLVKCPV